MDQFNSEKKIVIAHESSHLWIGQRMMIGNDNFDHQWFGEGFNGYICYINLLNSGIFSEKEFINEANKKIFSPHYSNQYRSLPNDSIAKLYLKDQEVQRLPYTRGWIYAFYLDNQISFASKGRKSLRDFLQKLYKFNNKQKKKNSNYNLALEDFKKILSEYLPQNQVDFEIGEYMIKGNLIDLSTMYWSKEFNFTSRDDIPTIFLKKGQHLKNFYSW
ncbi:M1 family aminopeptidase [Chryseobacterium sp. JJR-5R]|uniref:M1 family aminopeptidase n=1 Tax=Chryseobacterium sp. JJR-5R TaxID=3093923 RepID=UPI002A75DEF7|nr:M1 family aminopeptidase [Chryseobacterium sp. JJR-5R]WPO83730.1 M1 family aminopeptidase [Chryseobacterium sp. JJR-5R]